MQAGSRFASAAYVMSAVAVLLTLLKVSSFSDAQPYLLEMVPATHVAKAAQPAAGDGGYLETRRSTCPRRMPVGAWAAC